MVAPLIFFGRNSTFRKPVDKVFFANCHSEFEVRARMHVYAVTALFIDSFLTVTFLTVAILGALGILHMPFVASFTLGCVALGIVAAYLVQLAVRMADRGAAQHKLNLHCGKPSPGCAGLLNKDTIN